MWPKTNSYSISYARRIPWNQVVEAAYVGTQGRDLVSRSNGNVMPYGAMATGTFNGVDMTVPVNRVSVASDNANLAAFRPYNALNGITQYNFRGESNYDSLQVTLSRQTSRNLQYFVAYTYGKTRGTLGDEYASIDPYDATRTYGVTAQDRTHILNISWNAFIPDGARGAMDNWFGRGLLNGWQLSGITSLASGVPYRLSFSGAAGSNSCGRGVLRHSRRRRSGAQLAAMASRPSTRAIPRSAARTWARRSSTSTASGCRRSARTAQLTPPYNLRQPLRSNHDLTLFKNFTIRGEQKIQFRVGFFNLFNQSFATTAVDGNDINLVLDTTCRVTRDGVPNGLGGTSDGVCDPTGGFDFTPQTISNFGKINLKRGHRVVEFVLKYYF